MDYESLSLDEREQFERSCLGKEKHISESAARAALTFYRNELGHATRDMYPCRFCGHWHLTGGSH